ncbi:hypothetical protein N7465_007402 [Penicillium sp. CMV-2018d]|nr:hypothetical protein N7465_007402 [Penicillium sp. CMV-2018d]
MDTSHIGPPVSDTRDDEKAQLAKGKRKADDAALDDKEDREPPMLPPVDGNISHQMPICGADDEDHEPGFWAKLIQQNKWRRGQRDIVKTGTLLNILAKCDVIREPVLRQTRQYMGEKLYTSIGYRKENIESFHMQAKGRRVQPADACYHCKLERGPYTSCIVFDGMDGDLKPCANCWWGKQVVRCSFVKSTDLESREATPQRPTLAPPASSVPTIEPSQCHLRCTKKQRADTHMDIQQQEAILSQQEAILSQQEAILSQQKANLAQQEASLAQQEASLAQQKASLAQQKTSLAQLQLKLESTDDIVAAEQEEQ